MILVLLVIVLAVVGVLVWLENEAAGDSACSLTAGSFAVGIVLIVVFGLWIGVMHRNTIPARIEMFEEENARIEAAITETVERYMEHEKEVFSMASNESAINLVSLYPELKSDTLVQQQIETYLENNKTIKQLREEQIATPIFKWWLYFGR